ncbi:MAG: 3-hydroxyacyl-CoA dehydrogenase NAD-binding domain-containing protein [Anaplasmataceae bacterium]|nr:3-hydroxyacyl-CoA dehydrogenase NAD-binding domain-containing protein [Anaplasmataceae bacterium]
MLKKIAVIGSGLMGGAITSLIANAGFEVILLDIVIDQNDKNKLAKKAIEKMKILDKDSISAGNIEDDLDKLNKVDWVIEVIIENLELKQELYKKITPHLGKNTLISSNTSTIALKELTKNLPYNIQERFFITHFFNPPKYLRLLEFVELENSNKEYSKTLKDFCYEKLGRDIIECNDTPGFIANRIGCFFLARGIHEIIRSDSKVTICDIDSFLQSLPISMPKTGIFGLLDLIGLDTFTAIADTLRKTLPTDDLFNEVYGCDPQIIKGMINDNCLGNKTKSGFYRKDLSDNHQYLDIKSGLYFNVKPQKIPATKNLYTLLTTDNGNPATTAVRNILIDTINYTSTIIDEIAKNATDIDLAMKLGYNWKYGPLELFDLLGKHKSVLVNDYANGKIAQMLKSNKSIYTSDGILTNAGNYRPILQNEDRWYLYEKTKYAKPVVTNASGSLWDIGDGIVCFEFTSKRNTLDLSTMKILNDAINVTTKHFKGMIIGNDQNNFSVGANIKLFINKKPEEVEKFISYGQETFATLKFAPFPVVSAPSGYAVGGGCEISLHCDGICAYLDTYLGLVEVNIGVIPGWGGCKEMLLRFKKLNINQLINQIMSAKLSITANDLFDMEIMKKNRDKIALNKRSHLPMAKELCLSLAKKYTPPKKQKIVIDLSPIEKIDLQLNGYDKIIFNDLIELITDANNNDEEYALELERKYFIKLIKDNKTRERIKYMLTNSKKLDN